METLGVHVLVECKNCDPAKLNDLTFVRDTLLGAAGDLGVHILGDKFHKFSPQGVTGIVAISESHFSIHTWPEYGYAALDVFTCGDFNPRKAADYILKRLGAKDSEIKEIKRGFVPVAALR
ncbi:MAG: adenosylmethionine decarboxylase [Chloroflexi bacterium]|nr:adenosylmethionine decarboxylase [Chloroflexota bacterium]